MLLIQWGEDVVMQGMGVGYVGGLVMIILMFSCCSFLWVVLLILVLVMMVWIWFRWVMWCRLMCLNLEVLVSIMMWCVCLIMWWLRWVLVLLWVVRLNCRFRLFMFRNRVLKLYELRLVLVWLFCSDSDCWCSRLLVSSMVMFVVLVSFQVMFRLLVIIVML